MINRVVDPLAADEQRWTMGYGEFLARWGQNHWGEWVDGEVIVVARPTLRHQRLIALVCGLPFRYARRLDPGEVVLSPFAMPTLNRLAPRRPDGLFVGCDHLDRLTMSASKDRPTRRSRSFPTTA